MMKYKSINTELSGLGMCIAGAYKWLRWWCRLLAGCLYRSCVKTQTVSRAGTGDLTLHCRTWSPCGPRHLGNISQGIQQHGIENSHIPTHHPDHPDGEIKTVPLFSYAKHLYSLSLYYSSLFSHLYLHIFKTEICSIDTRYINIGHISEVRIFGSICPCYETRAIFSGGIGLV